MLCPHVSRCLCCRLQGEFAKRKRFSQKQISLPVRTHNGLHDGLERPLTSSPLNLQERGFSSGKSTPPATQLAEG